MQRDARHPMFKKLEEDQKREKDAQREEKNRQVP